MKVVLDANIIIGDFNMQSPNFKILFEESRAGKIELYIPQVVLEEVYNKYTQWIEKCQKEIDSELKKINKLSNKKIESPITKDLIAKTIENYNSVIDKIIIDNKVNVLDYPKTDHKFLVKKAILNKKPFNANEKGYRDCLIWENIKSILSTDEEDVVTSPEVIFITNNNKDFASSESDLHEDLIAELEEENLNLDVKIYSGLGDFTEKVTKLYLAQEDRFKGKLKNNEFWDFELKSTIDHYLFEEFVGSELNNYHDYAPSANSKPTISSINEDYKLDDISVKKLSSSEYIVDVNFELETEMDYFVDKYDYYSSDEVEFNILDLDWNDHVVHVSYTADLPLSVTLIINSKLECLSIQINKVNDEYE